MRRVIETIKELEDDPGCAWCDGYNPHIEFLKVEDEEDTDGLCPECFVLKWRGKLFVKGEGRENGQ